MGARKWRLKARRTILAFGTVAALAISGVISTPMASQAATQEPCDIYAAGGTPCVAAHSTTRALYSSYDGALYQVSRASDNTTMDIGPVSPGSYANAAAQDSFCAATTCLITVIYDQSGRGNDLTQAPGGGAAGGPDNLANAAIAPVTVAGHKVYGVYVAAGTGYRNNNTSGIATGDQPEGEYAIFDGTRYNSGCCFDYGNAETDNTDDGNGTMEAIYFGSNTSWGRGGGTGPWIMADMENGLFSGVNAGTNSNDPTINYRYTTALLKGGPNQWAIRGGNAQSGGLSTFYNGVRPNPAGYNPMKKQGAIVLGIGGDNSKAGVGTFYEGVMTSGYPSDATEDSVQANITATGYSTLATGWTKIGNVTSGLVVDGGGNVAAGSAVKQWNNIASANLQWHFIDLGNGYYEIVNDTNGLVIDSGGNTTRGSSPIEEPWSGSDNQEWQVKSVGSGNYQIINRGTSLCLDGGGATTAGSALKMWSVGPSNNLQWTITSV
ncbi:arabinofuranosidase catalytic domain-containing protein [Streptomyces sp. NPDC096311]|uniref:arabinofuranosidase catalytic domain-containing protein n=1 Tax=Streptomyces sp. NPDC096311 TaxID=3366083 RepID=UPI003824D756